MTIAFSTSVNSFIPCVNVTVHHSVCIHITIVVITERETTPYLLAPVIRTDHEQYLLGGENWSWCAAVVGDVDDDDDNDDDAVIGPE